MASQLSVSAPLEAGRSAQATRTQVHSCMMLPLLGTPLEDHPGNTSGGTGPPPGTSCRCCARRGSCRACGRQSAACATSALRSNSRCTSEREHRTVFRRNAMWSQWTQSGWTRLQSAMVIQPMLRTRFGGGRRQGATRTGERHLDAELLLEGPKVVAGGQRLVHVLAEHRLSHQPRLYLVVRLRQAGHQGSKTSVNCGPLHSPA